MLEFIQLLNQRYQTILSQPGNEVSKIGYQQRIDQLILAEAFMRKGRLINSSPEQPLQMTIVGPTQAGKSSLVNVLLNSRVAGVSPLAGYTIHPQGFCHGVSFADCSGLQRYFGRFQQFQQAHIPKDRHDCYSLTETGADSPHLPHGVLWDTPDFDSIDSATYREGVIRAIALADIIILVVSKEKYADQSVWDIMSALEDLHQPTVICLNKLSEGSEALLIQSLKEKWQLARKDDFPEVVSLYYQKQTGLPFWPETKQTLLIHLASKVDLKKHVRLEQDLLQKHWKTWLEPVIAEHQTLNDWDKLVDEAIKQALVNYQRDYLNHPHHYETFQQALAELLTLLEIPGLAGILTGARKVLTWPVRQMMKLGRKRLHIADSSQEIVLLNQIAEHLLIQLADRLMDNAEQDNQRQWWKEFSSLLRRQRKAILQDFSTAAKNYHVSFQQDVEKTAQRLYHKLQEQPMVLNSLRATRVTTDAAAIALTLHMGGIGVHDLIFAPAMLTVTSLLTESAIGSYMHKVEQELKQHQHNTVKQALFVEIIGQSLLALPEQLSTMTHFNISPDQLKAAEFQLTEKRHGLRLL
ncbi:MAG: GTPase domain-containing protein [Methylococcaceae bacterium]|jgi:GTPase SAR1 family protein|nr:GTPase domain-containing protein [Methylococcaceae bacterium]MDD1634902.1 GTPase domain-containing protein [Methylococcaceae bacterium]